MFNGVCGVISGFDLIFRNESDSFILINFNTLSMMNVSVHWSG